MRKLFLLALMAAAFSGNADAQAESKHVLNYQGTIKITNGSELKNQVTMNFKIYDAPVGGKLLWQEDQRTVNVKDGFFNVYIGEIQSDLAERVDFSKPVYLEITVDNEVLPRTLISASSYSFTAGKAEIASSVADGAIKWSSFEEDELKAGGVLEGKFPNPTLNADKIKDNSIDGNKIKGGHYPHIKATPAGLAKGDLRGNFPEAYVKNGVIDSKHLKNGAVIEDVIAKDAVTADKIADGAVVAGKLGEAAVGSTNIADGAVVAGKLGEAAVGSTNIADDAVIAGKLGDDAVVTKNIKNDAVTAEKIADGAVVAGKLGDDAVDSTNIKDGAVIAGKLGEAAVDSINIADGAVVAGKLGEAAVDSINIADGAVVAGKLGDDAVVTKNIKNEAVTAEKIADGAVVAGKLGKDAVDSRNIADGAVVAGKLGEAAVGTTNIEDKAVTSEKIAEGAITLDKIKGAPADKDKVLQLDKDGKAVWSDIAGGINKLKDTPKTEGQMFVYHNGEWKLTEGNAPADGSVLKYSNIYKRYTWEKESGFTLPYINDKATDNLGTSSAEDLFRIKRTDGKLGNVMELANTDAKGEEVLKVTGRGNHNGFTNGAMNVTATSNSSYDTNVNKGAVVKGIAAKGTNIGLDASAEGGKTAVGVFAHDKDAKAPKEGVSASLYAASSKGNAIYAEGAPAIAKDNYVAQVKATNNGRSMYIEGGDWNRNLIKKEAAGEDKDNAALVVVAKPKDAMPQIISDAINDPLHPFFGAEGRTAIKTYGDIWANSAIGGTTIVGRERIVVGTEEGKLTIITPPTTTDAPVNFDRVIEAPGAVFNGTDEAKGGIKVVKGTTETFKVTPDGDVTAHDATINGTLDVTGTTAFTGKINAKGGIEVKPEGAATAVFDVTTTGYVTASGEVQANGGLKVDDKFTVADGSGNITASGTAEFKKDVTIGAAGAGADLSVKDGNIKVTKGTTETFKVTPDGNVTAHDATINGTLDVTGTTSFTGKINAKGGIEVKPEGAATAVFDVTTDGDVTANDLTVNAVTASGEVQANGGLKVDDKFTVADGSGNITASGTAEFKKDVTIGAAGAGADLSVKDGNIKVTKGTAENFTVDNTGNVVTKGTITQTHAAANAVGTTEAITGQVDATGTKATITAKTGDAKGKHMLVTAKGEDKEALGSREFIISERGFALGRHMSVTAQGANREAWGSEEWIRSEQDNALGRYLTVTAKEADKEALGSREFIISERGFAWGRHMLVTAQGANNEALGSTETILSEQGNAVGRKMTLTAETANAVGTIEVIKGKINATGTDATITAEQGDAKGRWMSVTAQKEALGSREFTLSSQGEAKGRWMTVTAQEEDKLALGSEEEITSEQGAAVGKSMLVTAQGVNNEALGSKELIRSEQGVAVGRRMVVNAQGVGNEALGSRENITSEQGDALGRRMTLTGQVNATGTDATITAETGDAFGRNLRVEAKETDKTATGSTETISSAKGDALGKDMSVTAQGANRQALGNREYIRSEQGAAKGRIMSVIAQGLNKEARGSQELIKSEQGVAVGRHMSVTAEGANKEALGSNELIFSAQGDAKGIYLRVKTEDVTKKTIGADIRVKGGASNIGIYAADNHDLGPTAGVSASVYANATKGNALYAEGTPDVAANNYVAQVKATNNGRSMYIEGGDWNRNLIKKEATGEDKDNAALVVRANPKDEIPTNVTAALATPAWAGSEGKTAIKTYGDIWGSSAIGATTIVGLEKVVVGTENKFIVTHDGNVTANDITFNGTLKVGNPDAANNGKVLAQKADGTLEFVVPGAATITRADVINKINSTGAGTETINVANLTKGTANQILVTNADGNSTQWSSDLTANDLTVNAVTASGEVQANGGLKVVNGTAENFKVDNTGNVVTKGTITQRNEGAQNAIGTIEVIKGQINATGTDATITAEQGDALGRKLTVVANEANKTATGSTEIIESEQGDGMGRKMTLTGQKTATGFESAVTAKTGDAFGSKMTLTAEAANAIGTTEAITGKVNATGTDATITATTGNAYGRILRVVAKEANKTATGSAETIFSAKGNALGRNLSVTAKEADKEALGSRESINSERGFALGRKLTVIANETNKTATGSNENISSAQGDALGRKMFVTSQGVGKEALGSREFIISAEGDAKGRKMTVKASAAGKKAIGADIRVHGNAGTIGVYATDNHDLAPTAGVSASIYGKAKKGNALYAEGTPDVAANNYVAQVKATNNGRSMYIEGGDWNRNLIKKEAAGEDKDNAALVVRANPKDEIPANVTAALGTPAWAGSEGKTAIKTYGDIWGSSAIGATTIVGLEKVVVGTENKFIVTHDGNVTAQNLTVNGAIKYSVSSVITDPADLKTGNASIPATVVQLGTGTWGLGIISPEAFGNPATGVGTIKYIINNTGIQLTIQGVTVANGKTITVICTRAEDTNPVWTVIAVTP